VNINRGLVFWGVALISAGAVALAIQGGAIDGAAARELWRFWPVILILIGVAIIAARTPFALIVTLITGLVVGGMAGTLVSGWPDGLSIGCGGEATQLLTDEGTFSGSAEVELDFDCGDLTVDMADGDRWDVDARYAGTSEPRITSNADSLRVVAEGGGFPGFNESRQAWNVILPRDVQLALEVDANAASSTLNLADGDFGELSVDANAGSVRLDLAGASVAELSVDANAGSVDMSVDDGSSLRGSVEMNAGSLDLCVPEGVALEITMGDDNITFSHNLDDRGLTRSGDTWRSGDGAAAVVLTVEGNAASFTLNPEDGCS
jgi:hypothetical protein